MTAGPQLAVSVVEARRLAALAALPALTAPALAAFVGEAGALAEPLAAAQASHLYFGSEFCEHLFPAPEDLARAVAVAAERGLTLVLATPVACDRLVERILAAAAVLPPAAEILVNDWGVASALRAAQPARPLVAGRQLAKMLKEPRVAAPAWMKPYRSGYAGAGFRRLLGRLGIARLELDVPPFATAEVFAVPGLSVSAWAPFAYVAKGRICKVAGLALAAPEKFAPGGPCHRECLGIVEVGERPVASGLTTIARGNSLYYRHDAAMAAALADALAAGAIDRLVLGGAGE